MERFRQLNYSFGTALTLGALLCLGLQILADLEHRAAAVYSLPIYAAVFVILLIFFHAVSRANRLRPAAAGIYHALFILHFAACFLFDAFYEDALHRRYSLLDADSDNVAYLVHSILPWSVILSFAVSLLATYALAVAAHKWIRRPRIVAAVLLVSGSAGAAVADRPALHAFVASDLNDYLAGSPPGAPSAGPHPIESYANLQDRSIALAGRYKRVILFVMESITVHELERDCSDRPCFYQTHAANTHSYTNYFAANQDSRTGILSLLYSAFIPFHAYADRDVEQYEGIAGSPSLVNALRNARYSPAFAASVLEHERVIRDLPWAKTFYLGEDEARGGGNFTCLHPYEFERSCEDRILLDREMDFLAHTERPFLLHEFIYGHSSDYNEKNHVSSVRYYSDYIEEIMGRLKAHGLLDETLVIVTSDHGIRDRAAAVNPESYHIPLFFISSNNVPAANRELFGHIDFRRILAAEELNLPVHSTRKLLPVMGATGSAMTGILYGKAGIVLIKNRRFGPRAIETRCEDCMHPADITPALEEYRTVFRKAFLP